MKIRREYQTACPACHARTGRPCSNAQGEKMQSVHFQRSAALRAAAMAAFHALYAPLATHPVDFRR